MSKMVRTRKTTKRTLQKSPENEPPSIEEKRPKLKSTNKSKYFEKEEQEENPNSEFSINIDSGISTQNSSSNNSLNYSNSRNTSKVKDKSDSDDSSSDEFMKVPFSLNDLGEFETLKKDIKKSSSLNNLESRLSDNSDEEKINSESHYYDFSQIIKSQELITHTKREQEDKAKHDIQKKLYSKSSSSSSKSKKAKKKDSIKLLGEELGILELLAIAEGPKEGVDSESDSDDNQEVKKSEEYSIPEDGVQVTVELPNIVQKKKSKGFDMEAAVKRRINLIRKENQVFMHKVHVLCWIAHGMYLNQVVNNESLMGLALSLIPSAYCYPPKNADLNCLQKLVEWFVKKVVIDEHHKLSLNGSKLTLLELLEMQINNRIAISHRDLVLIFVSMVRSLGINARLVVNLRAIPLRPPVSDLCQVSNNPKDEKTATDSTSSKILVSEDKAAIKSKEQIKQKQSTKDSSSFIKNKLNISKLKETCDENDSKSPYFSSSDDIPLKELVDKNFVRKSNSPQIDIGEESTSRKVKNSLQSEKKLKPLHIEDLTGEIKRRGKSLGSLNHRSKYFNNNNKCCDNSSTSKHNETLKDDIVVGNTGVRKLRRPLSKSSMLKENSSSEDDVKIPAQKIKSKGRKNANISIDVKNKTNKLDSDDNIFEPAKPSTSKRKSIDRRVLSSDDDGRNPKKVRNDYWVEVFLEYEEKWINVDLCKGKVLCTEMLYRGATQPVRYVLAWNNDGSAKDVTRRYAPQWLTETRRQRAEDVWWRQTVAPYKPLPSCREKDEDEDLDRQIHDKPLPSSVKDYKNHPLFALRRHLLKFQAIYPPDPPILGFVLKKEPVYSRGCVVELHTREAWMKEAKLVRRGEEPYKIVKARPKWDKMSQTMINDLPLPLFGYWQVEDYIPPPAVGGKVPRNEYGNVELYKPCMLPPGTVHLQVPQLARVARKLEIDCAPAVVGWEFSGGGSHPILDGFIVCEEFKEVLLDAWSKEMDESAKRAKERIEQRVYGNWKRLIKGLLIRERLKARYDFGENVPEKKKKKQQPKASTSKS